MFDRRTILITLASFALAVGTVEANANQLEEIKKKGVIRIAVPQDNPLFGTVTPDGKRIGYDIEVAELVGRALNVQVELMPINGSNRVPFLETGRVDIVISNLGKNAEREKIIDFSQAYAPFYSGVFGPSTLKVKSADDLVGINVGVGKGSLEDLELTKIAPKGASIRRFDGGASTISAYLSGQVDAIAAGNVVVAAVADTNPDRKMETKFLIKNSPCFIGIKKGEGELLAAINAAISKAKEDGSLNAISQKWMKEDLPTDL